LQTVVRAMHRIDYVRDTARWISQYNDGVMMILAIANGLWP
jgi:hypothetical protein